MKNKKYYGFVFEEEDWIRFIEKYLKNHNIQFILKRSEKEKRLWLIEFLDKIIVIGTRPTSPRIATDLEFMHLYYNKIKEVFRLGTCGGYQPFLKIGDVILCTSAIRGEGTSKYYVSDLGYPAISDFLLTREISNLLDKEIKKYYIGTFWTTDARFSPQYDPILIENHIKNKVYAVDMDSSSFFMVSKILGMLSVNLGVVIDLPKRDKAYSSIDLNQHSIADSLRRCVETYMEYILKN